MNWSVRPIPQALQTPHLGWEGMDMREDRRLKPFALQLLEEHRNGKSVEELSRETGIPAERIGMRLSAAADFLERTSGHRPARRARTNSRRATLDR